MWCSTGGKHKPYDFRLKHYPYGRIGGGFWCSWPKCRTSSPICHRGLCGDYVISYWFEHHSLGQGTVKVTFFASPLLALRRYYCWEKVHAPRSSPKYQSIRDGYAEISFQIKCLAISIYISKATRNTPRSSTSSSLAQSFHSLATSTKATSGCEQWSERRRPRERAWWQTWTH